MHESGFREGWRKQRDTQRLKGDKGCQTDSAAFFFISSTSCKRLSKVSFDDEPMMMISAHGLSLSIHLSCLSLFTFFFTLIKHSEGNEFLTWRVWHNETDEKNDSLMTRELYSVLSLLFDCCDSLLSFEWPSMNYLINLLLNPYPHFFNKDLCFLCCFLEVLPTLKVGSLLFFF